MSDEGGKEKEGSGGVTAGPSTSSGKEGRGYSGSGGKVVNYQDLASLDVDHYDYINAPQFVDFSNLAKTDDPNADLFFEIHREEDDFMIPVENLSPTIQLLQQEQRQRDSDGYLSAIEQEVNATAAKDGMDDVQFVYYSSPGQHPMKRTSAKENLSSLNSSLTSFHTPMGMGSYGDSDDDYDKENFAPPQLLISDNMKGEDVVDEISNKKDVPRPISMHSEPITPMRGMLQELEKLKLVSSDDEVDDAGSVNGSTDGLYWSPTKSIATDEHLVNSVLRTPGVSSSKIPMPSGSRITDNIASASLARKLVLQDEKWETNNSEIEVSAEIPDNRKTSILVNPLVGREVVWHQESRFNEGESFNDTDHDLTLTNSAQPESIETVTLSSLVCNGTAFTIPADELMAPKLKPKPVFRSVESLTTAAKKSATLPIKRNVVINTVKSIQRKLTIPQSPNHAAKRPPPRTFSSLATARASLAKTAISTSTKPATSSAAMGMGAYGGGPAFKGRPPIRGNHYVSVAEQVNKFYKNTPERFRSLPRNNLPVQRPTGNAFQMAAAKKKFTAPAALSSSTTYGSSHSIGGSHDNLYKSSSSLQDSGKPASGATYTVPLRKPERPKATIPQPFHFSEIKPRKPVAQSPKDEYKFKARPAPKPNSSSHLNQNRPPGVTKIVPFQLRCDKRGAVYQEDFKKKTEAEELKAKQLKHFHANPPSVIHKPAFVPLQSEQPLVEPLNVDLMTGRRAGKRKEFDEYIKDKEEEKRREQEEEEAHLEEQQRMEDLERRRLAQHRAQPFKVPKPFEIRASEKALTVPHSPAFTLLPSQRRMTPRKMTPQKETKL